jgi:hypothetical protein
MGVAEDVGNGGRRDADGGSSSGWQAGSLDGTVTGRGLAVNGVGGGIGMCVRELGVILIGPLLRSLAPGASCGRAPVAYF